MKLGHLATTELAKKEYGSDVIIITRRDGGYRIVNPRDVRAIKDSIPHQTIYEVIDFDTYGLCDVIMALKRLGLRGAVVDAQ